MLLDATLLGTPKDETEKTRGAAKLGVSERQKQHSGARKKLAGQGNKQIHKKFIKAVRIQGPKKTNQNRPKLVSKDNEHEHEWTQQVRSLVFWCPRESKSQS